MVSCANVQNKEPHQKAGTVHEHFHVKRKKRENKFGGGRRVFIEWCESLCNDRSLMKWSLVFDSQCGECVGPSVTVTAFQHRSLATRKPARATGGGGGPTRNNVFLKPT